MEKYLKNSVLIVIAFYAIFAAIIGIMYVMDMATQSEVGDWLARGAYIALISLVLSVVIGFISHRGK